MASSASASGIGGENALLAEILSTLKTLQRAHAQLATAVEALKGRPDSSHSPQPFSTLPQNRPIPSRASPSLDPVQVARAADGLSSSPPPSLGPVSLASKTSPTILPRRKSSITSRVILTTYPGQSGIDPLPLEWGHPDPQKRGPVVVSRHSSTIRRRNAIGAHGGSYSIYHALAVASSNLNIDHRPDFTNTEPAAVIGPFPAWGDKKKIVAMDPLGHLAPWVFSDIIRDQDIDIRPTIAVTRAHMKIPELEQSVKAGRLVPDGRICISDSGELNVTK